VAALGLSGCAEKYMSWGGGAYDGTQLSRMDGTVQKGNDFDKALFNEYMTLARGEYTQGDYADADRYAYRAREAANAQSTAPQNASARKLPQDKTAEINQGYARLVWALGAGAKQKAPADAARAQVMFDCWLEQQEENLPHQAADIAKCRTGFLEALGKIESPSVIFATMPR
jgi:OOP family OmpA-OmpF porin